MTRRSAVAWLVAASVAIAAVVCWIVWVSGLTAAARLRRQFGIDTYTTDTIRAGFLERVAVGTTDEAIVRFLADNELGNDPSSRVERDDNEVTCAVYPDDRAPDFETEHYRIVFVLDASHRLADIQVKKSLLLL